MQMDRAADMALARCSSSSRGRCRAWPERLAPRLSWRRARPASPARRCLPRRLGCVTAMPLPRFLQAMVPAVEVVAPVGAVTRGGAPGEEVRANGNVGS